MFAADMTGFSRLMEADETGTLARLRTDRIELIDTAIAKKQSNIIKTTGDGMLVEFRSAAVPARERLLSAGSGEITLAGFRPTRPSRPESPSTSASRP